MRQYGNLLRGRKKYAFDSAKHVHGERVWIFFLKKRSVKAVDEKNNIATFVLYQIINRIKFGSACSTPKTKLQFIALKLM